MKNLQELLVDGKMASFDALLDIPGLCDGMTLTTLQSMMAMDCKDESNPILPLFMLMTTNRRFCITLPVSKNGFWPW
jgi:hypothetical protein